MANNLPTDDNQKPVTPVDTPPSVPETPSVIPETPEETPTEKPAEPIIEIGSLGQPSLSTIQETGSAPKSKSKKVKTIVSVLGLLLIIISLPLSVILVKQRQEIRKQAAFNDIQITFESETAPSSSNGGTYSTNFKVANTISSTRTVVVRKDSCYCSAGNPSGGCNDNCSSENVTLTIGGNQSTNVTISARQPSGSVCGSFQTDLTVLSVN